MDVCAACEFWVMEHFMKNFLNMLRNSLVPVERL